MSEKLLIMTWYWQQRPQRHAFGPDKVNRWAAQLRQHLTIPHELACVTDLPGGIDPDIRIIPLPKDFVDVRINNWSEASGMPQCYRRLTLFAPHAAEIFGAKRFVSMDTDVIVTGRIDRLFEHDHDFRIFGGTSKRRPYNGSMVQMTAGARPQVYTDFTVERAREARSKFIGSDQAWISLCLGWDEAKWTQADGVYAWSPNFMRKNRRPAHATTAFVQPPAGMRMMFFPGFDNPWEDDKFKHAPWVSDAWHRAIIPTRSQGALAAARKRAKRFGVLWAYDDRKQWGRSFMQAAKASRAKVRLFVRPDRVPDDARAFVRLDQQGQERNKSRDIVFALAERGITTLPTRQEAIWYDDKVAQVGALERWLPTTFVKRTAADARALADAIEERSVEDLTFPIISKSAEGAASMNVRVINDRAEAEAEIRKAFGSGIAISHHRIQQGYVYWQRLVPDQEFDIRICVVGRYWYGLTRYVRPGTVMASGSGNLDRIVKPSRKQRIAARLCMQVAEKIGTRWMAFDVVFDTDGRPKVLEISSAWTMAAYKTCPLFDHRMRRVAMTGADSFKIACDVLQHLPEVKAP